MPKRIQIVCICEGEKGSADAIFVNQAIKALAPKWLRLREGSQKARIVKCGNRKSVIEAFPGELRSCLKVGADTVLLVLADVDDDLADSEALKREFWKEAEQRGITKEEFESAVFLFPKDRIENWIEFLNTGKTDESREAPRVKHLDEVRDAANRLGDECKRKSLKGLPPSLEWACKNWQRLEARLKT